MGKDRKNLKHIYESFAFRKFLQNTFSKFDPNIKIKPRHGITLKKMHFLKKQ